MDKGILDDLRRFVCRFQAMKGPLGYAISGRLNIDTSTSVGVPKV